MTPYKMENKNGCYLVCHQCVVDHTAWNARLGCTIISPRVHKHIQKILIRNTLKLQFWSIFQIYLVHCDFKECLHHTVHNRYEITLLEGKRDRRGRTENQNFCITKQGKSILQVPDTRTRVLDNTRPFLGSSIVSCWITPARSKERKYRIFGQYLYTKMFQYSRILGHSSIWDLKYTFSQRDIETHPYLNGHGLSHNTFIHIVGCIY